MLTDLTHVPFPVAYPLAWARDEAVPAGDRVDNFIFTAYQAMRTTTLVLLADYLSCAEVSEALAAPIRGLRMPHWGEWTTLAQQLVVFWRSETRLRESRVSHLVEGWRQVAQVGRGVEIGTKWPSLLAQLKGLEGPARSANDAIQRFRNDRAHRSSTKTLDTALDAHRLQLLGPLVEEIVRTLFPKDALTLFRRVPRLDTTSDEQVFSLLGPHIDLSFAAEKADTTWAEALQTSDVIAIVQGQSIPLYPLFAGPTGEMTGSTVLPGGGLTEPAALIDGIKERTVVLLGVRSSEETSSLVAAAQSRFASKQVELALHKHETAPWMIADWARASAREGLAAITGRKYFPECYVERYGIDSVVDQLIDTPGKALLLLGEAGSGKSSLLARLVDRLTSVEIAPAKLSNSELEKMRAGKLSRDKYLVDRGQGDVVLYLSGAEIRGDSSNSGAQILVDAVLRKAGVSERQFDSLASFAAKLNEGVKHDVHERRRVVIVLDALNEAERYIDILRALDSFLPCVYAYRWLRLVVALRSGAYHAIVRRNILNNTGPVLVNQAYFFEHESSTGLKPYLEIAPFGALEASEAYRLRQERLPENASLAPWDTLTPKQQALLLSPIYMHLFHKTFHGRIPSRSGAETESDLFKQYLNMLVSEVAGLEGWLQDIPAWMYTHRSAILPLAIVDTLLANWRADCGFESAARVSRLDPFEELVASSVLMRPVEDKFADRRLIGFQFTQQRMCEAALERELLRRCHRSQPTKAEFLSWVQHAAAIDDARIEFPELVGALQGIATRLVEAGDQNVLPALLESAVVKSGMPQDSAAERALSRRSSPMAKKRKYSSINVETLVLKSLLPSFSGGCVIAMDVAKEKMMFGLATPEGETLQIVSFSHPRQTGPFLSMVDELVAALTVDRVVLVLEPTGTYGDPLVYQCQKRGVAVRKISPKRVHDAMEVFDGVPSMHDGKAATLLAKLHAQGISVPLVPVSAQRREFRALVNLRELEARTYDFYANQVEAFLGRHWPELQEWLGVRIQKSTLYLLKEFGSPAAVAANIEKARAYLIDVSRGTLSEELIEGVLQGAKHSKGAPMSLREEAYMQGIANRVLEAELAKAMVERDATREVEADSQLLPLRAMLGGYTTCAILAMSDPHAAPNAGAYEKSVGLNLKVKSSGEHKGHLSITKRGPSLIRKLLYLAALRAVQTHPIVRAWYQQRGGYQQDSRMRAVVAVMRKLARAIFHVARGEAFDPSKLFDVKRLSLDVKSEDPTGSNPDSESETKRKPTFVKRTEPRSKVRPRTRKPQSPQAHKLLHGNAPAHA